ncbi:MAG: aminotransferase class IV family protein [Sulfurimonas sp.]|nr:aminotransferase class IV family protein [Sulfurimonas sp.]
MSNTYLETIKALDGEIFNISYHQKRYESVLKSLGFNNFKNLEEYLKPPIPGLYRCRLIYDEQNINVTYHKYKKREVTSIKLVYDDEIEYSKKSTNRYELDNLFEKREDCDEILIIKNSLVTDTTIANVAFYKDGLWYTPKKPLLQGTTRARLLDEGKIIEKDIAVKDLKNYSKVALMNVMIDFDIIAQYNLKDMTC